MIRILPRRSNDVSYLTDDPAREIEGVRDGEAMWWWRAEGDARRADDILRGSSRGTLLGYDVIVAAPRPASCLLAVGTPEEQRGVVRAHRLAVDATLTYLDTYAARVRRTILGDTELLPTSVGDVAGFTHGINRLGDPHLHDHVLLAARARDYDRSLDARTLYDHVAAADSVYRGVLRASIRTETGRRSWRSFNGIEYVEGVDEGLRALWSGHNADRDPKKMWTRAEAHGQWQRDLERYEEAPQLLPPVRSDDHLHEHAFRSALDGHGRVYRHDLVRAWMDAATFGSTLPDLEASLDHHYPELRGSRPRDHEWISLARARSIRAVERTGPRALRPDLQRSREVLARSRDDTVRERSW